MRVVINNQDAAVDLLAHRPPRPCPLFLLGVFNGIPHYTNTHTACFSSCSRLNKNRARKEPILRRHRGGSRGGLEHVTICHRRKPHPLQSRSECGTPRENARAGPPRKARREPCS